MKRILILLSMFALFALSSRAGNIYPFRLSNATTTGEVDEVFFSASDVSLLITNLSGGGRRAVIGIIGGGGAGESNHTILVAGSGLDFTDLGGGTNLLAIDPLIVATNPVAGSGGGPTNVLDSAGGLYSLVGHTNQPTLLIKGLTNENPVTLTISDRGTMLGFLVTTQGGFGQTNAWITNGLPWAVSDTFGYSNASSVVGLAFTNLGGIPTIYLVPDSTIARTGQSQTWAAPQTFNSGATLTLGAPMWFKSSVTVSDNVIIVTNVTVGGSLTVAGNATISGNVNAGSFTGSMNGGNIAGDQSVGTNTLAAFGSNTGTIGSAGQFLVVHLNSAGIPDGWSTVTGNSLATSTNSISAVQLNGSWNNGVIGLSISNLSVATINGTTVTVGFASVPFETINNLHGSSLTLSNFLTAYGITMTNNGPSRIDLGGAVTMLSNSAGAFLSVAGSAASPTVTVATTASTLIPIITSPNAAGYKFGFNGSANGVNPTAQLFVQDGSNFQYLFFSRDGPKDNTAQGIEFNDSTAGNVSLYQSTDSAGVSRKRHVEIETTASVGGLLIVSQDGGMHNVGYQFYENDPRFPRILFTNNKAQTDTNTPALHETYASFGNWTNSGGSAALNGGAAIIVGSNENWLVACGRGLGSVSGAKDKEYPTNRFSGFLAAGVNTAQSNQTFIVIRDQTNGLWCIGVDTNGILGAYRTNDLSTTVSTY